jgi:hypothetical protein
VQQRSSTAGQPYILTIANNVMSLAMLALV